jgi:hypothetical protein
MITADWNGVIQPLLRDKPECDLEILFWVRLMRDTERELESTHIPSRMAHILPTGPNGLPELIPPPMRTEKILAQKLLPQKKRHRRPALLLAMARLLGQIQRRLTKGNKLIISLTKKKRRSREIFTEITTVSVATVFLSQHHSPGLTTTYERSTKDLLWP